MKDVATNDIILKANEEFQAEEFRRAVEREKERLRLRKIFWVRLFPWRIRMERRDEVSRDPEKGIEYHIMALYDLGVIVYERHGKALWVTRVR